MITPRRLDHFWYDRNFVATLLLPLSWLFWLIITWRRWAYSHRLLRTCALPVPVIVIGNISVGGSGKTPLVIWLAALLKAHGFTPGIISRGYKAGACEFPQRVYPDSDPVVMGDEAVLLAVRTACPVVIDPDRVRAAQALADFCNVIISDDGLQHYRLGRSIEIAVIDGMRLFGNGYLLPAGPLREPVSRLASVDFVVTNGKTALNGNQHTMILVPQELRSLLDETMHKSADEFDGIVHAVAGIGHPARFFSQLRGLGLEIREHPFPDHHPFTGADLDFNDARPVVMTEKDAVKCRIFAQPHHWYLPVNAQLDEDFGKGLMKLLSLGSITAAGLARFCRSGVLLLPAVVGG